MDGKDKVVIGGTSAFGDPDPESPSKEELDAELARANLLRMRGDYKGAIDQCLSILKRAPENLDAHTLIGDIYSESGDLVQSAQWYELALEFDANSHTLLSKLAGVRERAQHKEIAETAEQLGLPTDGPRVAVYSSLVVIFIVIIGIAAYLLGQRHPVPKRSPLHISIEAPGTPDEANSTSGDAAEDSNGIVEATAAGAAYLPQDDRALALSLSQRDPLGSHIMSVLSDPRSKLLTINYSVHGDEDIRKIGAELARSSLDQAPDVMTITLRGARDDKLAYIADVARDKMNDSVTANDVQGGPSDGWIPGALSYEWLPSASGAATQTPATTPTAPATASPTPPASTGAPTGAPTSTPKDSSGATAGNSTTGT